MFVPNLIKVPINDKIYIIPIACPLLKAAANKASPKGTIEKIKLFELNPTIDTIKVNIYSTKFCLSNNPFAIFLILSFLFNLTSSN